MSGHCDNCGDACESCGNEDLREDAPLRMLDEEWKEMISSWNWNVTAVEAAHELREKARETLGPDFYIHADEDENIEKIAEFGNQKMAQDVIDAWNGLEAIDA